MSGNRQLGESHYAGKQLAERLARDLYPSTKCYADCPGTDKDRTERKKC